MLDSHKPEFAFVTSVIRLLVSVVLLMMDNRGGLMYVKIYFFPSVHKIIQSA